MIDRYDTKFLAAILALQDESKAGGTLTEDRARQALTVGPPLTIEERRLIWLSPDARDLFLAVRRQVRADMMERVRDAGLGTVTRRLAASGSDTEEVSGAGFTVTIFHDDVPGSEWSISVELGEAYRTIVGPETVVVLKDAGGHVWASGVPDSRGCFSGVWERNVETPQQRLQKFDLMLEP